MNTPSLSPFPVPSPEAPAPSGGKRMMEILPFPIVAGTTSPSSWPTPPAGESPKWLESPAPDPWPPPPLGESAPVFGTKPAPTTRLEKPSTAADFTDDELSEAFGPIVEKAVRKAVYSQENGIDTYLEPMLRATIRRALAEYSPASRPFEPPGVLDRLVWHLRALFTSRTYEDILFEKTRRFQVEEVFLLDSSTLALVSFASCDPARHASVRRVTGTAQKLASQLRDASGRFHPALELSATHRAIARRGRHVILVAIVRGRPSELMLSDLEFSLRRIEDYFRDQFTQEGSALLHELQPFLEDCLLIQSPAGGAG
jgi:hypothetical protein